MLPPNTVGTEKAWESCMEYNIPTFFAINKTDKENVDVDQVIADLQDKFSTSIVSLTEPIEGDIKKA